MARRHAFGPRRIKLKRPHTDSAGVVWPIGTDAFWDPGTKAISIAPRLEDGIPDAEADDQDVRHMYGGEASWDR